MPNYAQFQRSLGFLRFDLIDLNIGQRRLVSSSIPDLQIFIRPFSKTFNTITLLKLVDLISLKRLVRPNYLTHLSLPDV